MKIQKTTTLNELERMAKADPTARVVWAVHTCWWGLIECACHARGVSVPVDPRGSVLMEGELALFLEHAKANPSHYGKHGLDAFMAAYHENLVRDDGWPWSLESWDEYNKLIDGMG